MVAHFLEFLRESEGADAGSPTNTTDGVAGNPQPMFTAKRFGKRAEFEVPHDVYEAAKNGRNRGDRWDKFIENADLQGAVRKVLYEEGNCLITSQKTGAAVLLRHVKMQRMRYDQEMTGSQ